MGRSTRESGRNRCDPPETTTITAVPQPERWGHRHRMIAVRRGSAWRVPEVSWASSTRLGGRLIRGDLRQTVSFDLRHDHALTCGASSQLQVRLRNSDLSHRSRGKSQDRRVRTDRAAVYPRVLDELLPPRTSPTGTPTTGWKPTTAGSAQGPAAPDADSNGTSRGRHPCRLACPWGHCCVGTEHDRPGG